jgi:hypothetical protein
MVASATAGAGTCPGKGSLATARLRWMPPRARMPVSTASARLRRLQHQLPDLSVSDLLRVRDAAEVVLGADRVGARDVDSVLAAVGGD